MKANNTPAANSLNRRGAAQQAREALRQSQEQLQIAQDQLRLITDTMPVGATQCNRESRYLWVSHAYSEWLGKTPEEIIGHSVEEIIGPSAYEVIRPYIQQALSGQKVEFEARMNYRAKGLLWISATYNPTFDTEGVPNGWISVVSDITHRKELERTKAQLAAIVESSDDAIISKDLNGVITSWNAAAERLFLYRPEEIIGQPIIRIIPPELHSEEIAMLDRLRQGERVAHFETVRLAKDGRRIPVSLTISPILDAAGVFTGISSTSRDITERQNREARLRESQAQLARTNAELEQRVRDRTAKLEETVAELEGFSYSLIHDMRAPLRAIQSFAALLHEECVTCDSSGQMLDYLRRIKEAASRMDKLITDSLNYSRVMLQKLPVQPIDVAKLLRGIIESYPNFHHVGAEIKLEFDRLIVQGNESALTQCISGILSNAVKFVAPGVTPKIRIWAEQKIRHGPSMPYSQPPMRTSQPQPSMPDSQYVRIWFEDNGIGIPKHAHEKIFDMFQRMHRESEYPGTGIGLTIVRKAVQRMGGRVGLKSEPGKGTKFWVELPEVNSPKQ